MPNNLHGLRVLITRQERFAQGLIATIESYGGVCELVPMFDIESLLDESTIKNIHAALAKATSAVFITRNAAEIVIPHLPKNLNLVWAAIGPSTGRYLQEQGLKPVIYPQTEPFDSESLVKELKENSFNFSEQKIIIFNGEGGREWLQNELVNCGAVLDLISVYRRNPRKINNLPDVDIILVTCITSLVALPNRQTPLLVVSERIHQKAIELGFLNVYTTKGMSETAIVAELLRI